MPPFRCSPDALAYYPDPFDSLRCPQMQCYAMLTEPLLSYPYMRRPLIYSSPLHALSREATFVVTGLYIYSSRHPQCQSFYCPARSVSRCFSTARFESMNLSTQFCMQLSSLPASLPDDIELVMHFLKQVSVSSWTDLCTCVFWFSCCMNCCNSRLSPGVNLASSSVLTLTASESSMTRYVCV